MRRVGDLETGDEVLFFLPKCSRDPIKYRVTGFDYSKVRGRYILDLDLLEPEKTEKYTGWEVELDSEDLSRFVLVDQGETMVVLSDHRIYENVLRFNPGR